MNKMKELLKLLKENDINKVVEFMRENIENIDLFIDELATSTGLDLSDQDIASISDLFYVVVKNKHLIVEASVAKLEESIETVKKNINLDNKTNIKNIKESLNKNESEIKKEETSFKVEYVPSGSETEVKSSTDKIGDLSNVGNDKEFTHHGLDNKITFTPKIPEPKISAIKEIIFVEDQNGDGTINIAEDVEGDKKSPIILVLSPDTKRGYYLELMINGIKTSQKITENDILEGQVLVDAILNNEGTNNVSVVIVDNYGNRSEVKEGSVDVRWSIPTLGVVDCYIKQDTDRNGIINSKELPSGTKNTDLVVKIDGSQKEGDVVRLDINGNIQDVTLTEIMIINQEIEIENIELRKDANNIKIKLIDQYENSSNEISKIISLHNDIPEGILGLEVVEDTNKDGLVGLTELAADKNLVSLKTIFDSSKISNEHIVVLTYNDQKTSANITEEDVRNGYLTFENIPIIEGEINSFKAHIIDKYGNEGQDRLVNVEFNRVNKTELNSFEIMDDTNKDGVVNKIEEDGNGKTDIKINLPTTIEEGQIIKIIKDGVEYKKEISKTDIINGHLIFEDVSLKEDGNSFKIIHQDKFGNISEREHSFIVDTINPSALDVNGIKVIEDANGDDKILGVEDIGNDKKTNVEVTLPTGISIGDKVVVTSQNQEYIYTIEAGDVAGQKVLVQDVPFVEGINSISIKMRDKHGNDYTEVTKSFIVDTISPENITTDSVSIVEDANKDGKILKTEDIGADHTTSIKVILPNNIEVGDKIRIELNGNNREYVIQTKDMQGNREITIDDIVYQEGINSATIKVIDKHDVIHSTVQKSFTVDTIVPDNIQTIAIVEDDNSDDKILSTEEQNADKFTNIDIVLPDNISVGDRVILTHSGNVELEYIVKQDDKVGDKITIADVPYMEGVNNISLKIIDVNGQVTDSVQKTFNVDTTNPSVINIDNINITEDSNGDDKILSAEDLLSDHTTSFKITIPEGSEVGDIIEINMGSSRHTHTIRSGDLIGNREVTINGVVYEEGANRATIKIIDTHGNTHSTVTKDFIVDTINPSNLEIDSISITEDVNEDGKILKSEDVGADRTTSFKVVLPEGVQVGDKVEISIGNKKQEYVVETSDLQGNREITIDHLIYAEGTNQAIIKLIDSHGTTHTTINKEFIVDTVVPSNITTIAISDDADGNNTIISSEDVGNDRTTDIKVTLPEGVQVGDRLILTHSGNTNIEYQIKAGETAGSVITISDVPYIEGVNSISVKIIDIHGQQSTITQKSFVVDVTDPSPLTADNVKIVEDANKDGKILKTEDIGADHKTDIKIVLPEGVQIGDRVEFTLHGDKKTHIVQNGDILSSKEITISDITYREGDNQAIVKIIDAQGVEHVSINKNFTVDTVVPSDLVIGNIIVTEDVNGDDKILSTEDIGSDKHTDIRVVLPNNIATGDRVILTHNTNTNVEYIVKNTDSTGSTITISDIPYTEGSNTIYIKIIDTNGQETNSIQKNFIVDTVNPSPITIDNIVITEDIDGNGKILANEDIGDDKTTSFKITLPKGVQVGDKVEVVLNNLKKTHTIQAQDIQGNREITFDGIIYIEGTNQATINIIDSHGIKHSTITKDFIADTTPPPKPTGCVFIDDVDGNGIINIQEDRPTMNKTNISINLPSGLKVTDKIKISGHLSRMLSEEEIRNKVAVFENVPLSIGNNTFKITIVDESGNESESLNASVELRNSAVTGVDVDKITIPSDLNLDGIINKAESSGNSYIVRVKIPSGLNIGDKIIIGPNSVIAQNAGVVTDRYVYNGTDTHVDFYIKNIEGITELSFKVEDIYGNFSDTSTKAITYDTVYPSYRGHVYVLDQNNDSMIDRSEQIAGKTGVTIQLDKVLSDGDKVLIQYTGKNGLTEIEYTHGAENNGWSYDLSKKQITTPPIIDITPSEKDIHNTGGFRIKIVDSAGNLGTDAVLPGGIIQGRKQYSEGSFFLKDINKNGIIGKEELNITNGGYVEQTLRVMLTDNVKAGYKIQITPQDGAEFRLYNSNGKRVDLNALDINQSDIINKYVDIHVKQRSGSHLFSADKSIRIGISPITEYKNGVKSLSGAKYEEYSYIYENRVDSPNMISLREDLDGNAILNKAEINSLANNQNLLVKLNGSEWIDSVGVKVFINGSKISDNSRKLTSTEMSSKNVNVGDLVDALALNNGDKIEIKIYNFHSSNPTIKSRESILTYDVKSNVQGSVSNFEVLEKTINSSRDIINVRTNSYDGDLSTTSIKVKISDAVPGSILFIRAKDLNNQKYHYLKRYEIKNEDISKGYVVIDGVDTTKKHTNIEYGLEDNEGNIGVIKKANVVFAGSNSLDAHIEMFNKSNDPSAVGMLVFIKKEEVPHIRGRRYNIELHAQKNGEDTIIWQHGDNSLSRLNTLDDPHYREAIESVLLKNPIASGRFSNITLDEIKNQYDIFYFAGINRDSTKFANRTPYEIYTKFNVFDEYGNKMSIQSETVDNFYSNLRERYSGSVINMTSLPGYNFLFKTYNANSLEEYKSIYGNRVKARLLLVPSEVNNEFNGYHYSGNDHYVGYKRHHDMVSDYNRIFGDNARYEIYYKGGKVFEGRLEKSNPNTPYLSYLNFEIQNNDWQLNRYSYKIYKKDGRSVSNTFRGDFFKAVDISTVNYDIEDTGVKIHFNRTNLSLNKHKIEISLFDYRNNSLVSRKTIEDLSIFDDNSYYLTIGQALPDLSTGRSYRVESKVIDKDTSNIISRKETTVLGNQYGGYRGKILESAVIESTNSNNTSIKVTFTEEFVNWLRANPEVFNSLYLGPNELSFKKAGGAYDSNGNNLGIPYFDAHYSIPRSLGSDIFRITPWEIKQNRVITRSVANHTLDGNIKGSIGKASTIVLSVFDYKGTQDVHDSYRNILETHILKDNGHYLLNSESTDIGLIYSVRKNLDDSILFKKDENYRIDKKINGHNIGLNSLKEDYMIGDLYVVSNKELMSKRGLKLTIKSEYEDGSVFEKTIPLRNNLDAGVVSFPINEVWFKNGYVKNTFRIFSADGTYDKKYYNSFDVDLYRPELLGVKIANDTNNDNKLTIHESNENIDFIGTENPDSLIKDVLFELTFEDNEDLKRFKSGKGYENYIKIKTTAVDGSWKYEVRNSDGYIRYNEDNKKIYVLGTVKNGDFTVEVEYSSSSGSRAFGKSKSFETQYTIDLVPVQPPKIEFLESLDGRYIGRADNLKDGDVLNTGIRLKDLNRIEVNEKILLTITTNGINSKIEHIVTQNDLNRGHIDFTTPIKEGTTSVSVQVESINGNKSQIYTRHMDYDTKVGTIEYTKIASDLNGDGVFSTDELNNDKSKIMIGVGNENLDVGDKILISHNNNGVVTEQTHILKSEDIVKKEIIIDVEGITSNSRITSKIVDVHGNESNIVNSSQGGGIFNEYNQNKVFTGIGRRDTLSVEENVDFTLIQNIGNKLKGVDGILINSQKSISLSAKEIRSMLDIDNNLLQIEGFSGSRLSLKGDFKPMLRKEATKELGDFGNNFTIYSAIDDLGNNLYIKVENHIHVDQS